MALDPVPGLIFENHLQATHGSTTTPFYHVVEDSRFSEYVHDVVEAKGTISKVQQLDSFDNVFVVLAHDDTICPVVPLFPSTVNEWKSQGWHEKCRWAFLKDFNGLLHAK